MSDDGKRFIPRINGFAIDCIRNENHERESDITDVPVETGANLTDNIKPKNRKCSIEGIVSDTPNDEFDVERLTLDPAMLPSQAACDMLEEAWANSRTVTVETGFRTYQRMAIQKLSMPRDSTTGRALNFSIAFEEIRVRTAERVTVALLPVDGRVAAKKKAGTKGATAAPKNINNAPYIVNKGDTQFNTEYGQYVGGGGKMTEDEFVKQKVQSGKLNQAEIDKLAREQQLHEVTKAPQILQDHPLATSFFGLGLVNTVFKDREEDSL